MATAPPTWKQYQCQIPLFTAHPGMGGENLSLHTPCRALFRHRSPSRQNTTSVVPRNSQGSALSTLRRPTSTQPRPTAGQQRSKARTLQDPGSFHRPILYVTMVSRDGRPFPEHVATTASTTLDKTSLLRHPPASLPPLDPIKEKAGDSTKEDGQGKTSHHPTIEDQHLKQSPLYSLFLSETWDRLPLSQLVALRKYLGARKYNTLYILRICEDHHIHNIIK
jgi:hypothetical protein